MTPDTIIAFFSASKKTDMNYASLPQKQASTKLSDTQDF